ncbi:SET domain-containing protein-lysine N-methyltransferase [Candidatus Pacearchaeota archaeon]|nr:SET domain-containing protein-lysine N-methyltransferase [Candidatus Pacearchaeota archaeon]
MNELPRLINHSCDPNSFVKGKNELIALKDITKGEEITYDYSTTMNDNEKEIERMEGKLVIYPCNCKSRKCRNTIDQFKTLPKEIQEYYLKNNFAPDFILRKFQKTL